MKLTENFALKEFLVGNEDAVPTKEQMVNMVIVANRLQVLRDIYGPIHINSGFRTYEHNETVQIAANPDYISGTSASYHMLGMAVDITIKGMTPEQVQQLLANWSGGLGSYKTFTHVDIRGNQARW